VLFCNFEDKGIFCFKKLLIEGRKSAQQENLDRFFRNKPRFGAIILYGQHF
jgi:hypothetical protein